MDAFDVFDDDYGAEAAPAKTETPKPAPKEEAKPAAEDNSKEVAAEEDKVE